MLTSMRPLWAFQPLASKHYPATIDSAPEVSVPSSQRAPFGWTTATIASPSREPLLLSWPSFPEGKVPTHLRIAVALDERDEKIIEAFLPKSKRVLGTMSIRFPAQFQLHQLALDPMDAADIRSEGIGLRVTKGSDLEVFRAGDSLPVTLRPHLLTPGTSRVQDEYLARMNSLAVIQSFGWMEGCVLDGLLDLSEMPPYHNLRASADQHLGMFIQNESLIYDGPRSNPMDGRVYGIEGSLPFAALARTQPDSPLLEIAIEFWRSRRRDNGEISDGTLTSEGAYTVGYAMAEVAKARGSDELMRIALEQSRIRQQKLFDGTAFDRTLSDEGTRGNRNWARGIAWQMLGLVRTLRVAKDREDIADLVTMLQPFAQWTIEMQRDDGLWSVFADKPNLAPDTGGSAGIAAALAIAAHQGWLEQDAVAAATKTLSGLQHHLTPDGFLDGVAQSNKGGESLQRGDYRVIYQMGMGLMAQLIAALQPSRAVNAS
ncbi:Glycosyl Hydrolase Family 88 [Novipirellula artificiosorum]|uniref:Glycosyl Hydrolase Family 88 n=2 Tax=Novipirellula artificiosorum TaxID=2528016 RepID=A0A5C6DF49_9BACT|nr:Glycosyl Hydrolase Family 88 [Novipirellula artificiosorum]